MMEWAWVTSALSMTLPTTLSFILLFIGVLIGLVLGLTGSGGSLLAVPLLVVLLPLELPEAIGISLAVVAFSAMVGAFHHFKHGLVIWPPTLFFAVFGSAFTPLGYQLGQWLPSLIITLLFSGLTLIIAVTMWKKSLSPRKAVLRANASSDNKDINDRGHGVLFSAKSMLSVIVAAALTGVLSGLLGVGGGFVIVPALTLLLGMSMRHAVASSLVIITLVSSVGFYQYLLFTPIINTNFMAFLMAGSAVGMGLGIILSRRMSSEKLQKIFSVIMVLMAAVMLVKNG
ncbi:sulfite exporter TauE/SafE family protein [Eionea flava]